MCCVLLGSCDDGTADGQNATEEVSEKAVRTYARIVAATYADSLEAAETLNSRIDDLVSAPSEAKLEAAKDAWLAAREPYLQSEVFRFYDGPIDETEGLMNAWPMDESHVDYVLDADGQTLDTGLINGDEALTRSLLLSANEQGGEENIATGFHPIEFLLWGQDRSDSGPGERPYADYLEGSDATAENGERRGAYLSLLGELLVDNLDEVRAAWASDQDNYRAEFESDDSLASVGKILTGMIILSGFETGGERLQAAIDSGDQEDEHSCFSDNTHRDMIGDVLGVQNVYEGRYERLDGSVVEGTGIYDVVASFDTELADEVRAQIETCLSAAQAIEPPFDQEIAEGNTEGRARVQTLIDALYELEGLFSEVFAELGLSVDIPD